MKSFFHKEILRKIFATLAMISVVGANTIVYIPDLTPVAQAAFNQEINYQGKLANSSGTTVPDGSYNVRYKLYTAASGGSPIWTETDCYSPDGGATCNGTGSDDRAVVSTGLFSTLLGSINPLSGVNFDQTLYLGVEIGGNSATPTWDGEMTPRKTLGAVPAAFVAQNADELGGLTSSQFLRSDADNASGIFDAISISNLTGPLQAVNGVVSASSSLSAAYGGTGITSYNKGDVLYGNTSGGLTALPAASNGLVLKLVGGVPQWASDLTSGGGGGAGAWATSTDSLVVYPTDTTNTVVIGSNATTSLGNIFEVVGNSKLGGLATIGNLLATGSSTLQNFTFNNATGTNATSTNFYATIASSTNLYSTRAAIGTLTANAITAGTLALGNLSGVMYATNGSVGTVATSSLNINSDDIIEGNTNKFYTNARVDAEANAYIDASTTIAKTYSNNTYTGNQTFNGSATFNNGITANTLSVGSLNGLLFGTNGSVSAVSTSSLNLSIPLASTTGSLSVAQGGTGISNPTAAGILVGSYGGGSWQQLATSSLGLTTTNVAEGTNLYYTNGRVDTEANSYINGSTTIPKTYTSNAYTANQTFNNGLTANAASVGSLNGVIYGTNGSLGTISTSSLNINSDNIVEGVSNLFYTNSRVQAYLDATSKGYYFSTTSAAYFIGQNNGLAFSTTSSNYWLTQQTTDSLAQGAVNKYYSDAAVNSFVNSSTTIPKTYSNNTYTGNQTFNGNVTVGNLNGPLQANNGAISATTSIGVLYGGTGLTAAPTLGQLLVGNANGGYTLSATSSLNIAFVNLVGNATVAQGGTGATSFGQGWIYSTGGTNALAASTSPTVNYIVSTSTTHASTFAYASTTEISATTASANNVIATNNLAISNLANPAGAFLAVDQNGNVIATTTPAGGGGGGGGISTIGPAGQGQIGPSITFATSSTAFNGLTSSTTITAVGNVITFSNSLAGILGVAGGGTGLNSAPTYGQLLVGNANGGYTLTSTSSLGIGTSAIGAGTQGWIPFYNSSSNTLTATSSIFIGQNGNVGIGSTTPFGLLAIEQSGGSTAPILNIASSLNTSLFNINGAGDVNIPGGSITFSSSTAAGLVNSRSGYVSGNYAYVTSNSGLSIFDISNPAAPILISTTGAGLNTSFGLYVSGRYAYVMSNGNKSVVIFDVSNPANPTEVGSISKGLNSPLSVFVSGRYAYVTDSNGLVIFDVSNPSNPILAGSTSSGLFNPKSVYVSGRYAYVADAGNGFIVFDISNPATPIKVAAKTTGLVVPNTVYVSGRYAYITDSTSGLVIFDISNPTSPVKVAATTNGLGYPDSIYVSGRYAYVGDGFNGLVTFDISSSTNPVLLASNDTSLSFPTSVSVSGHYAYIVDGISLATFDLGGLDANAANIGSLQAGNIQTLNDLLVGGQAQIAGGLNVGTGGIFSSGPLSVSVASSTQANAVSAYFQGLVGIGTTSPFALLSLAGTAGGTTNLLALSTTTSGFATSTALTIDQNGNLSLLNGSKLTLNTSLNGPLQANNGLVSATSSIGVLYGGTGLTSIASSSLLLGNINGGYTAFATSSLGLLSASAIGAGTQGWIPFYNSSSRNLTATSSIFIGQNGNVGIGSTTPFGILSAEGNGKLASTSLLFAVASSSNSSMFNINAAGDVNVSGTSLTMASSISAGLNDPFNVFVSGHYAYVVDTSSLTILDVTNPSAPVKIASTTAGLTGPGAVYVSGRYAYVTDSTNGLVIFDISNPASPVEIKSIATGLSDPFSVYVSGRYAYVIDFTNNSLVTFDISNPASPVEISSVNGSLSSPQSVFVSGHYAYIASDPSSGGGSLAVFDISNPVSPVQVGLTTSGLARPNTVYVSGRYAYVTDQFNQDLVIFDISNPASPAQVGSIAMSGASPFPDSVFVSGRYAYVVNQSSGSLIVVDVSTPSLPVQTAIFTNKSSSPESVYVSGRYAYVANTGLGSISIYDLGGLDANAANIGALQAGNLQVTNDIVAGGQLQIGGGLNVGAGGIFSSGPLSVSVASSSQANALSAYFQGFVGIGTTSPYAPLSVLGQIVGSYFTSTTSVASQFPYASTTAITIGTLNGPLQANNGFVSATSSIGVLYGGTGLTSAPIYGQVLLGNASGGYTLTSTSSLGLTGTGGTVTSISTDSTLTGGPITTTGTLGLNLANANIWTGLQQFNGNSSTTILSVSQSGTATTTILSNATSTFANGISATYLNLTGTTASSTAANGINLTAGCFSISGLCLGTGSGNVASGLSGQLAYYASNGTAVSGTSNIFLSGSNVGIGSTSPLYKFSVEGTSSLGNNAIAGFFTATSSVASVFPYASTTALSASNLYSTVFCLSGDCRSAWPATGAAGSWSTTTSQVAGEAVNYSNNSTDLVAIGGLSTTTAKYWFDPNALTSFLSGNVGIGTTSPYASLSVAGLGVFNNIFATSTTATSTFAGGLLVGNGDLQYSVGSGVTSISNLQIGNTSFDTDAGVVSWVDLPVDSNASAGVTESYSANIAGNPLLTIYSQANGSGGVQNTAVGIGTTSPFALLSVQGNSFVAGNQTASNFIATSSVASQLPYASTTAITIGTLNGLLLGTNGAVGAISTSSLNLSIPLASTTGTLAVANGGTGLTSIASSSLLIGNANGGYTAFATSSLGLLSASAIGAGTQGWIPFYNSSSNTLTATSSIFIGQNNNVGIGTTSPWSPLSVNGNVEGASYSIAGTPILTASTTLSDVFIGDAGTTTANMANLVGAFLPGLSAQGQFNTAAGYQDLYYDSNGVANSAFGSRALYLNTNGAFNSAFGVGALEDTTSGSYNTAVGAYALQNNTSGASNSALGYSALQGNTTGASNAVFGAGALEGNTIGSFNIAMGSNAGYAGNGGYSADVFLGYQTNYNASGVTASTTEVGYRSGYNVAGNDETLLGYQSGYDLTSGNNNIAIGYNVDLPSNTNSNQLNIGNLIYGTGLSATTNPSSVATGGNVGIGTTSPYSTLSVAGQVVAQNFIATSTKIASTFPYASTTAITIGTLNGPLQANNGFVSATTSIGVLYGGTGLTSIASSSLLIGNANGGYTAFATSSLGILSSQWTTSGSNIFYNTGNVGIGSSTPFGLLSLGGNTSFSSTSLLFNIASSSNLSMLNINGAGDVNISGTSITFASTTGALTSAPTWLYVSGKYVYLTGGTSGTNSYLAVFDITNPAAPMIIASTTNGLNTPSSVYVSGRYAYVTNKTGNTLEIFDVSNPSAPTLLSSTAAGLSSPADVYVSGHYAYVTSTNNSTLVIFDVSNPSSPAEISSLAQTQPIGVFVSGKYAYIGAHGNLDVVDISNPASPVQTGSLTIALGPGGSIYVSGRYAYHVGGAASRIFDISNPASPAAVSTISGVSGSSNPVYVSGRYAYIPSGSNLLVYDVSSASNPVQVASTNTGLSSPVDVSVSGRYAYVADATKGLVVLDLGGLEANAANIGSLQAGNLQVTNDLIAGGQIQIGGGLNVGTGGIFSAGSLSVGVASSTQANAMSAYFQGLVGIGTTSPYATLSLAGAAGGTTDVFSVSTSTSAFATSTSIRISQNGNLHLMNGAGIDIGTGVRPPSNGLLVAGNVGIGTTSPYALLSVAGQTVSQYFTATSSTFASTFSYASTTALSISQLATAAGAFLAISPTGLIIATTTPVAGGSSQWTTLSSNIYYNSGNVGIGTSTFATANAGLLTVDGGVSNSNVALFTANQNNFIQAGLINANSGNAASSDFVVGNDKNYASSTVYYGDLGINSSGNADPRYTGLAPSDVYLYSSDSNLDLGTASTTLNNASSSINFFTGGLLSNNLRMTISNTGDVGIGTTTPGTLFSIQGIANFDLSTTTFQSTGGINLTNGCFAVQGVCLSTGGGGGGSGTVSSGSVNQLAYYTGATTVSSASNLALLNSNLGISSSTPWALLSLGVPTYSATQAMFAIGSTTSGGVGTTTVFDIDNNGSTNIQNGQFFSDATTATTSINQLQTGMMSFDTNAGAVTALDLPISTTLTAGTVESYTFNDMGSSTLTIYGQADGNGNVKTGTLGVGIASSTPWGLLSLFEATSSTIADPLFVVATTTPNGGASTAFIIDQNGNVGIGSTTPWRNFDIDGTVSMKGLTSNAATQSFTLCLSSANEVIADSATCAASSERFKQDITSLAATSSLAEVMALNPVSFYYTPEFNGALESNPNFGGEQVGFIAEDVQKVDPRLVVVETGTTTVGGVDYAPGTPHTVRYENMTALLAGAVQEQQGQISDLSSTTAQVQNSTSAFTANLNSVSLSLTSSIASSTQTIQTLSSSLDATNLLLTGLNSRIDDLSATTTSQISLAINSLIASTTFTESIASSTADILASSSPSFISRVASAVEDLIASTGNWVVSNVSGVLASFTRVQTQTAAISQGLEMTDQATGQVYCVEIKNGDWDKSLGSCASQASATSTPSLVVSPITPAVQSPVNTPQVSAPITPAATSTTITPVATTTPAAAPTTAPAITATSSPVVSIPAASPVATSTAPAVAAPAPTSTTPTGTATSPATTDTTTAPTPVVTPAPATDTSPTTPVAPSTPAVTDTSGAAAPAPVAQPDPAPAAQAPITDNAPAAATP